MVKEWDEHAFHSTECLPVLHNRSIANRLKNKIGDKNISIKFSRLTKENLLGKYL